MFSLSFISTKARFVNPAVASGSTKHLFGHQLPTMILSSDAAIARGSKAPNQASDELTFTTVPPGRPCLQTTCAYSAPLRTTQNIPPPTLPPLATLPPSCPLRHFST